MRAAMPLGWVVLLCLAFGCNGRREEEARARAQEEARRAEKEKQAGALKEALIQVANAMNPAKARADFKLVREKVPARQHAAVAKLEECQADRVEEVQKAAEQKAYATIATVSIGCIVSMDDLTAEARRKLLAELLDEKAPKGDDTDVTLVQLQNATRQSYVDFMVLMLDVGPEEARGVAWEAATAEVSKRLAAGARQETLGAVLQRAHKGERVPESKARMAAKLKELGVPLEPEASASAAASTGS